MRTLKFFPAVALILLCSATIHADRAPGGDVQLLEGVPAPSGLKVEEGHDEGHKSPIEVVKQAIEAAKEDEIDKLRALFHENQHDRLSSRDFGSREEATNLQTIATLLAQFDADKLDVMTQGTVGNYAVVTVRHGDALHLIRVQRLTQGENEHRNWYLTSSMPTNYRTNYAAPGVQTIREAITGDDVTKMREHLDDYQTRGLELLRGVNPEVDPYQLLQQRLKRIIESAENPTVLLNLHYNAVAFWYNSDKGDKFVVFSFREERNWQTNEYSTTVFIDLDSTSNFHTQPLNYFRGWVHDYDW
jgi:hypothetical protein